MLEIWASATPPWAIDSAPLLSECWSEARATVSVVWPSDQNLDLITLLHEALKQRMENGLFRGILTL